MRALVYNGPWQLEVADRPAPALTSPTDCLVRVVACGICGTDLGIIRGGYPASCPPVILGHEAAGEVVETGAGVSQLRAGDRVAINPTYYCGSCRLCRTGRTNHCVRKDSTEAGVSSDGALAEYYVTDERFLHRLAPRVSFDEAALAEPLSCVLTGVNKLAVRPAATGLVLGLGPIGLMYALVLAAHGMRGIAVEPAPKRRHLAREILSREGWTVCGSTREACEVAGDAGIDIVVDASGTFDDSSLRLVASGGQVLLVALHAHRESIDLGSLADRSISLIGSIDSLSTFDDACDLLASGRLPTKTLISEVVSLADVPSALGALGCDVAAQRYAPRATTLKMVVRIGAG